MNKNRVFKTILKFLDEENIYDMKITGSKSNNKYSDTFYFSHENNRYAVNIISKDINSKSHITCYYYYNNKYNKSFELDY